MSSCSAAAAAASASLLVLGGCGGAESPTVLRLVDLFAEATVTASSAPVADGPPKLEWRFDEPADAGGPSSLGWQARDVRDFGVRDGRLRGTAATALPLVHVERTAPVDGEDLLHAVEIELRTSAGGQLAMRFESDEKLDLERALADPFPWPLTTPLVPGEGPQRYSMRPARPTHLRQLRHLLVRPTDVAGADFEILAVRVVGRREHLDGVPSGFGWHGMQDRFRESLVTRAPETLTYSVTLPERAWIDLAVATIEDHPAKFRVEARAERGEPIVFERTVTRPHRWEPFRVALDALGGQRVELSLGLDAERAGQLGFWGTAAIRGLPDPRARKRKQGVIVLLADTLRSDHLDAWGYSRDTAPTLARLASEGTRARDCISQATWTKVSVPAIFTSLYPSTHTVADFTDRLPAAAETMAERFRQAGYATLALTSIPFTGQFTNLHQGYEELHESTSLGDSSNSKTAREYMDRLLAWLEDHRDVPFFVFLHVADPHSPYRAYTPYDAVWGEAGDPERLTEQIERVRPHIENPTLRRFGMPTRQELERAGLDPAEFVRYELDAYDGSIRAMDVEVGRLLERLDELGLGDRTLLAFVSDHGTEFLDHDRHFHGQTVYGELNRVPMFLWGPGVVPAAVTLEPTVQTIDLMPTVLELAGIEPPSGVQGRSLVPLMRAAERGEAQDWSWPAITEKARLNNLRMPGREYESIALIAAGWKLIRHDPVPAGGAQYELYDHRADPLNLHDLAAGEPARVADLAELLAAWRERALATRLESARPAEADARELERLRALGYLN